MPSFDLNIFSILVLIALLVVIHLVEDTINVKSRLFRMMISATILMNVLEILSWVFNGAAGDFNWYMNYTFNFLFTALGTIVVGLWACYIDYHINKNYKQLFKRWHYFMPAIIMIVLSVINIYYPILFTINSLNEYARLPLIWSSVFLTIIVYIFVLQMVIRAKIVDNRKVLIGVVIFLSLPIVAAILQMLFLGKTLIWPSTAIAVLISYLIFETTANSKDYLTGLFTRERAEEKIDRYLMKKKSFSVIMLDINNFKKINDTKSHHFGDQVLVEISNILLKVFEKSSIVSRYGGDEFIVVSGICDEAILRKKKEEINKTVKESVMVGIIDLKLSCGISICTTPESCAIDEVIIRADNNMYKDKELIKNKKR